MKEKFFRFALATATASMLATGKMFPSNAPKVPLPPILREVSRRSRNRQIKKAQDRATNEVSRRTNRKRWFAWLEKKGQSFADEQRLINRMTGWQRTRWQRECCGPAGLDKRLETLERYASLPHWKGARV